MREGDKGMLFSEENVKLCLVAKVMSHRKTNADSFWVVMKNIWKVHDNTRIEFDGSNIYVILEYGG